MSEKNEKQNETKQIRYFIMMGFFLFADIFAMNGMIYVNKFVFLFVFLLAPYIVLK